MTFRGHPSNLQALAQAREVPAVQRLAWFNHGFMRAQVVRDELVLADLRMGSEPHYFFRFAVARREGAQWQAIRPRQLETPREFGPLLSTTWHRIWRAPATGAPAAIDRDTR
jgi:inner membrane protein